MRRAATLAQASTWLALLTSCVAAQASNAVLAPSAAAPAAASSAMPSARIEAVAAGPYHHVAIPMAWQVRSRREDLGDLRVLNAEGQSLPYAWVGQPVSQHVEQSVRLKVFRWQAPGAASSAVPVGSASSAPMALTGPLWVVDLQPVRGHVRRLQLHWPESGVGLFRVAVDTSADMQRLHPLVDAVELAALRHEGQVLRQDRIDLDRHPERYVRLRLLPGSAEPPLQAVEAVSTESVSPVAAWSWSGPIQPSACTVDACEYVVPTGVPLGRLKVALPEPNMVWALQVHGRRVQAATAHAAHGHHHHGLRDRVRALRDKGRGPHGDDRLAEPLNWAWLTDARLHWIVQAQGVSRSEFVALPGAPLQALRLSATGSVSAGWARHRPAIEVATWSRALVFLARGTPPYRLTLVPDPAGPMAIPLDQLMPPVAGQRASLPPMATLGALSWDDVVAVAEPAKALAVTAVSVPALPIVPLARSWMLWAALLLGLGVMAFMVRALLTRPAPAQPPPT